MTDALHDARLRLTGADREPEMTATRTLITGGVRSGKSRLAETLLADQPAVTYLAPGPSADPLTDPEWAIRVAAHQDRRPASWTTVETADLASALAEAEGAVLLDCLGTWVTSTVDRLGTWELPLNDWQRDFDVLVSDLVSAWLAAAGPLVAVTNEVGLGVVPPHRSGRIFRDLLGSVNQQIAATSDDVILMVAGRSIKL